jgi:GNAT superfamily N-acetyltransferase
MAKVNCTLTCQVEATFRTHQIQGMFDLPIEHAQSESFAVDLPGPNEEWTIGVIVGPSGSGKTTLARAAYGDQALAEPTWNPDRAIIDQLGDQPIEQITRVLTSVGLGSAPSWLRPYHVLSGGEQFRCQLARKILSGDSLVVCDEFTSPLDRVVARNLCIAVSRFIRRAHGDARLVVVSSHCDILRWLTPDWTLDMATRSLRWRRLRRPPLRFAVHRCPRSLWDRFARHHYLSGSLSCAAKCYAAVENENPIAFCGVISMFGRPDIHRISRLVTLPAYQGLGIGSRLLERVAQAERGEGYRVHITTSHPALVHFLAHSTCWRNLGRRFVVDPPRQVGICPLRTSRGRFTASFEYLPAARSIAVAAA